MRGPAVDPHPGYLRSIANSIEPAFPSAAAELRLIAGAIEARGPLDILFDGPPSHEAGRFVECEVDGRSVNAGEWLPPTDDAFWRLRVTELPRRL